MCSGNGDSTEFVQRQHRNPPLVMTFQDEHYPISISDIQRLEITRSLIAQGFKVFKSEDNLLARIVRPYHCRLIGLFGSPNIHYIVSEIKVFGNNEV